MVGLIRVTSVGKRYRRYPPNRSFTLQEAVLRGLRSLTPAEHFWALREVSFEITPGKMVGVLGTNGAGKSTLLRLVGGVERPDEGQVEVIGRVGALLDLGAGFHPDLTGRENLYINGVISGLTRREITARFDEIVAFSELEQFIDSPLRTYSSGMQMRLGFSIAVHINPEILLIDEALSVGDIHFQQKCLERIESFKENGCTVLLVTHDPSMVSEYCDEAMWLRAGRLVSYGAGDVIAEQYLGEQKSETERRTPREWPAVSTASGRELVINETRVGSMEMELVDVHLTDPSGNPVNEIISGSPLCVEIGYHCPQPIPSPHFGVTISRENDFVMFSTTTHDSGITLPTLEGRGKVILKFERLDLVADQYYIDLGVYRNDWEYGYDYHWHVYPLEVSASQDAEGLLFPPHQWAIE